MKPLWQMTREEHRAHQIPRNGNRDGRQAFSDYDAAHREEIRFALDTGEQIPEHVLNEYRSTLSQP